MGLGHLDLTWVAGMLAEGMAFGSSAAASRAEPRHRHVALLFAFALVSDVVAKVLQMAWLAGASRPFSGAARFAYHAEVAISVAWPCALALMAARFFPRNHDRAACVPVGVWVGTTVAHVLLFPLTGKQTGRLFLGVEVVMLLWAAACAAASWRTAWRTAHGVVLFLLGTELVVVTLGPFATNVFRDWNLARVLYTVAFTGLAFWYGAGSDRSGDGVVTPPPDRFGP